MRETFQEDQLLKLCIVGDEKAWAIFVEQFTALLRWAIKVKISKSCLSIDENEVDDILQQLFTDIWRNNRLKALRNSRALSSWLVIIAQNATINFAREKGRFLESQSEQFDEDIAAYTTVNPRTETDNSQLYKTVEELISALPLKEQRIMALELFYDLKHRQIANIMGRPVSTISNIISRLKQDLKSKLIRRGYSV